MAITTLDENLALILIDLEQGVLKLPLVHPTAPVIENIGALIDAFHARKRPCVFVQVVGTPAGRNDQGGVARDFPHEATAFIPEISIGTDDPIVTKRSWGAFANPALDRILQERAITQVVIVGIATSMGVESTARQAHDRGLNVVLITDAMTDVSLEAHANAIERIFPRLAETGTTAQLLALLQG